MERQSTRQVLKAIRFKYCKSGNVLGPNFLWKLADQVFASINFLLFLEIILILNVQQKGRIQLQLRVSMLIILAIP